MTLALTPQMLEGAYELLRATPPFRGWKLPPADEVEFHVNRNPGVSGDFTMPNRIRVSANNFGTLHGLLRVMAHEMVHLHLFTRGDRADVHHGRNFKHAASTVCRFHLFDPKEF